METAQLSFFTQQTYVDVTEVSDVRTEGQIKRSVAYDVGEVILGSRKHEAALIKEFEESKSAKILEQIETSSATLAGELVSKKKIIDWFSFKEEKELGVEPFVAKLKHLLINRIATEPTDSADARMGYVQAAEELKNRLHSIKNNVDIEKFIEDMNYQMRNEGKDTSYYIKQMEKYKKEIVENGPSDWRQSRIKTYEYEVEKITKANQYTFRYLGDSFKNFFTKQASINSAFKSARKYKTWDDLLEKKETPKKKAPAKPVWERLLPERFDRNGGRVSYVEKAEDLVTTFGLKAVQFGHYTDDTKGKEHVFRSSEALLDLADCIGLDDHSLSLENELSLAFGARGRGKALGHYEPLHRIINFTRDNGVNGILAHEWAHALDHFLFNYSYDHENGRAGYLSDLVNCGAHLPNSIIMQMEVLMKQIIEGAGNATAHFSNTNKETDLWRISSKLKNRYIKHNGDLLKCMKDYYQDELDYINRITTITTYYDDKSVEMEKFHKKSQKNLKKTAQALAWYHEQQTGQRVEEIPYPSDKSQFFIQSVELDKKKVGKYWSSQRELFARCFEAFIQDELETQGRVNHYLVCGTKDGRAYPMGDERFFINLEMKKLIKEIVKLF